MQHFTYENPAERFSKSEAYIKDGVMYWSSNDRVPFDDVLKVAISQGHPIDLEASKIMRDKITFDFLSEYRKNYRGPSEEEERFEARSALGAGATVVNVLTGHTWRT